MIWVWLQQISTLHGQVSVACCLCPVSWVLTACRDAVASRVAFRLWRCNFAPSPDYSHSSHKTTAMGRQIWVYVEEQDGAVLGASAMFGHDILFDAKEHQSFPTIHYFWVLKAYLVVADIPAIRIECGVEFVNWFQGTNQKSVSFPLCKRPFFFHALSCYLTLSCRW